MSTVVYCDVVRCVSGHGIILVLLITIIVNIGGLWISNQSVYGVTIIQFRQRHQANYPSDDDQTICYIL